MQKLSNKAKIGVGGVIAIIFIALLGIGGVGFGLIYANSKVEQTGFGSQEATRALEVIAGTAPRKISRAQVEYQFSAQDGSSAQNNDSNADIDTFEWEADKNSKLVAKGYVDCTGVTPLKLDLMKDTVFDLKEEHKCKINPYKMTQGWTVGNTETNIDDYVHLKQADVTSSTGADGTQETNTLETSQVYLATVGETARATQEDIVPFAFLYEIGNQTTYSDDTLDSIESGTLNLIIKHKYTSFAGNHSKITVLGDCEDSDDNAPDVTIDSNLDGAISSYHTAAATVDIKCNMKFLINKDGYEEPLYNPLADGNSEKPYIILTLNRVVNQLWLNMPGPTRPGILHTVFLIQTQVRSSGRTWKCAEKPLLTLPAPMQ